MNKPKEEPKPDLDWQREDESDNMQKSEKPDAGYMNDLGLCSFCQGKKRVCEMQGCPQR